MKENVVYTGDCLNVMSNEIDKGSVDLVFADPPFNIGMKYKGISDKLSPKAYYDWTKNWLRAAHEVLKPTGSIFVAIGDNFAAEMKILLTATGLHFRNWIIWTYGFGQNCQKKFGLCHTHILYFTKDKKKFTFNADAVRVPSARQELYNDKRADSKGKIPSDVWQFPRVCGTFKERIKGHPCQMPVAVLERIVAVASNPGDLVLDPFAGTGTTMVAAERLKRKHIMIEQSQEYVDLILSRFHRGECFSSTAEVAKKTEGRVL